MSIRFLNGQSNVFAAANPFEVSEYVRANVGSHSLRLPRASDASASLGNPFSDASIGGSPSASSLSAASSPSGPSFAGGLDDPFSSPSAAPAGGAKPDPFASYTPAAQRLDEQHPALLAASELDLPDADDAASIRIAADIKKTLNEFGSPGDEPLSLGLGEEFVPSKPTYKPEPELEPRVPSRPTPPSGGG